LFQKAKDGPLQQFLLDKKKPSEKNFMLTMVVDQQGKVWVGTGEGLCWFDPRSRTFFAYKREVGKKNSLLFDCVLSLALGRNNQQLVETYNGLDVLNMQSGIFKH
jgi:ligand-binding sensor domain-containing protein